MIRTYFNPVATIGMFLITFLVGSSLTHPKLIIDKQEHGYTFRSNFLIIFGVGLKRLTADIIWIKTLLDSDITHYEKKDLRSWLYLRFLTISQLDPYFYENYYYGGQYLMIVKDDLLGAEDLMTKGLVHFPNDYGLNWQLGFLNAIERGDVKASFKFFDKIKNHPRRPAYFSSFFSKILAETVEPGMAFQMVYDTWRSLPDNDFVKERLGEQLYSMKAMSDLECLNQQLPNCDHHDFWGQNYIKTGGTWRARNRLVRTSLKRIKK